MYNFKCNLQNLTYQHFFFRTADLDGPICPITRCQESLHRVVKESHGKNETEFNRNANSFTTILISHGSDLII